MRRNVSGILRSLLQAGLYLVDQPDRAVRDVRDSVRSGVNEAGDRLNNAAYELAGRDHTLHYALAFAAGIGVGVGVGLLMAPDSGEETRRNVADKFSRMGERIKSRAAEGMDYQTGT